MEKFSFSERKDILIPNQNKMTTLKDENGNPIVGDNLLLKFANIAIEYERKNNAPVPIPDQTFVNWLKDGKKYIEEGGSSEDYFRKTLVKM